MIAGMSPIDFGVWTGVAIFLVTPTGRAGCRYIARALFGHMLNIWHGLRSAATWPRRKAAAMSIDDWTRLRAGTYRLPEHGLPVRDDQAADVESRRASIRQGIGYLRMARAVQVAALAINIFTTWLNIHLRLYASAGISVTAILALATLMAVMTRTIRTRRAQLHSLEAELRRPDYGQIAGMEREIFGRTFDHAR